MKRMKSDPVIVIRKVEALIPYAKNSRTHSDAQVAQVAASIREFGFTNPVLIDGDNGIIAGHCRVLAARKLKLIDVPCIELSGLTETQKRAYVIADNKLSLVSDWDIELLQVELQDLQAAEFDMSLIGFDDQELADIANPMAEETDMPELPTGDKEPFQQMTFTLHDTQAEQVSMAMAAAKSMGPFLDSPNENSNGNALARICETFLTAHGNG